MKKIYREVVLGDIGEPTYSESIESSIEAFTP